MNVYETDQRAKASNTMKPYYHYQLAQKLDTILTALSRKSLVRQYKLKTFMKEIETNSRASRDTQTQRLFLLPITDFKLLIMLADWLDKIC